MRSWRAAEQRWIGRKMFSFEIQSAIIGRRSCGEGTELRPNTGCGDTFCRGARFQWGFAQQNLPQPHRMCGGTAHRNGLDDFR